MPIEILNKLPKTARLMWESTYSAAKDKYGESRAAKIAWSAVKAKFKKVQEKWVARSSDFEPFVVTSYLYLEKAEVSKAYTEEGYTYVDYVMADNSPDIKEHISLDAMALSSFSDTINTNKVYGRIDADHSFLEELKRKGLSPEEMEEEIRKLDTGIEAVNARYEKGVVKATLKIRNDIYPEASKYKAVSVEFSHPPEITGKVIKQARLRGFVLTNNPRLPNARRIGLNGQDNVLR